MPIFFTKKSCNRRGGTTLPQMPSVNYGSNFGVIYSLIKVGSKYFSVFRNWYILQNLCKFLGCGALVGHRFDINYNLGCSRIIGWCKILPISALPSQCFKTFGDFKHIYILHHMAVFCLFLLFLA